MSLQHLIETGSHAPKVQIALEAMFKQTRMAMVITDPRQDDNPIVACNEAFQLLTGYQQAEILGRNCRFLQGQDTDPTTIADISAAIKDRRYETFEILNYRKDGSPFWNACHVSPIFDEEGQLVYFFGSQWDVSERVDAIRALDGEILLPAGALQDKIDQVRLLFAAVSGSKESLVLTEYAPLDEPGPRIVWTNAAFEDVFGYTQAEVLGRSPRMFQGPKTDRAVLDRIRAGLESGEGVRDVNVVNYRKNGSEICMEWSISPVSGGDGAPTHWLAIQRDVTQAVEARRQLELLSGELAHRYKNQLTIIRALQRLIPTEARSASEYQATLASNMETLEIAYRVVFQDGTDGKSTDAHTLAHAILEPFDRGRIGIEGPTGDIDRYSAINLSLLLFELATNAVKYGALSVPEGRVSLTFSKKSDAMWFDWIESGGPPVRSPNAKGTSGLGTKLLGRLGDGTDREDGGLEFAEHGVIFRGSVSAAQ